MIAVLEIPKAHYSVHHRLQSGLCSWPSLLLRQWSWPLSLTRPISNYTLREFQIWDHVLQLLIFWLFGHQNAHQTGTARKTFCSDGGRQYPTESKPRSAHARHRVQEGPSNTFSKSGSSKACKIILQWYCDQQNYLGAMRQD